MHSKVSPEKESLRFVNSLEKEKLPVILGLGALYLLDTPFFELEENQTIVLWEPNEDVYSCSAFQEKLQSFLESPKSKNKKIIYLQGEEFTADQVEEVKEFARLKYAGKLQLFVFPAYDRLFPDLIKKLKQNFGSYFVNSSRSSSINQNTIKHFQNLWTHNYLKNLDLLRSGNSKKFGWFQKLTPNSMPIVFVGASPGLENEIKRIHMYRNQIYLITSDTALGYLLDNQILPDLILSFDSGRGTLFHFLKEIPEDIPIITWLGGSPYLFTLPNPKILVNSFHPLDQMLEALFRFFKFPDWPSFPNPSLNLVGMVKSLLGETHPFWLTGVSFLSEFGKAHCKSTGYESYILPYLHRKLSLEGYSFRLYGSERKGKNRIAWDEIQKMKPKPTFFKDFSDQNLIVATELKKPSLLSFSGIPQDFSLFWKWAFQDSEGVISQNTIKRWLRD